SRSWGLLKANFWLVVGTTLLIYVLLGGIGAGLSHLATLWLGLSLHRFAVAGGVVGSVWHMIFGGSLLGGLYWFYLRLIRGYSPDVGDAFAGFTLAFAQLTLAYIVSALLTCAGLVFCFLPGIYLAVAWIFTLPLVIDKRMDFWEAMEVSRKVVTREWWSVFALIIVAGLVGGAGILACCVGVLVTAPIGFGEWVKGWGQLPEGMQFGNTHGCIVIDGRGRVLVNTDTENAVIIFDSSGKFLKSWGKDFKGGAHGMAIVREGDKELMFLAHTGRH